MFILQMIKMSSKRLNESPKVAGSSLAGLQIKLSSPDLNS